MISCFIIDDENSAINVLKSYVDKTPFLELCGTATDPLEALNFLHAHSVDLIFLDVQLPSLSGLDFMKMLSPKSRVILTTAYAEFAVQGFEQEALDYLLKPIAFERFLKSAQRALDLKDAVASEAGTGDYVFIKTEAKGKMLKLRFRDILYIEGLKNYVSIYTQQERIIAYLSFKELERTLPAVFMRVHKSYILSLDSIKALDGNQILLEGAKTVVPLGEKYRAAFFSALETKIMGGKK